jgi:hypothetical protein
LKITAEFRIHLNPQGASPKNRIRHCFIADRVRIVCENILQAFKEILSIPCRILNRKAANPSRIMAFKSVEDPARKC